GLHPGAGLAQTQVIDTDFGRGDFKSLGWEATGDWDKARYPMDLANSPGTAARFPAHKPGGSLIKALAEAKDPDKLTLSLDYGWVWGDAGQGADMVSLMLLDSKGDGCLFEVHRTKAKWAVQWAKVAGGKPDKHHTWAADEIDATHKAVRDGGGLCRLE